MWRTVIFALAICVSSTARAGEDGWVSLFNGKDLSNWVNVNCAPETWSVGDGVIKCTGKPVGALRTPRMYENFILELEWRHLKPGGNAGVFVWASPIAAPGVPFLRAIEVQVLDNAYDARGKGETYTTHGDIFPIHGSTMKPIYKGNGMRCFPIEKRSKSSPEWNHYKIVAQNGTLRLSVNGKVVSGGDDADWRKGYLGLESEGSPVEWRNIRIKELPAGGATAEQSAPEDHGWRSLYNGVDLRGWQVKGDLEQQWQPADWRLKAAAGAGVLRTTETWTDFELVVDVRAPRKVKHPRLAAGIELTTAEGISRVPLMVRPGDWTRNEVTVRGNEATMKVLERPPQTTTLAGAVKGPIGLSGNAGDPVEFGNLYIRPLK